MKPVIACCMPIANKIAPATFNSYQLLDRSELGWHHFSIPGRGVVEARNRLTFEALKVPEVTHLMWVDDDMAFQPDAVKRLLAHDLPIVGGLCHDRRPPYKPVIGRYFDPCWGYEPFTIGWMFDYPEGELIDVDVTGGAFLLVKREVFERIKVQFPCDADEARRAPDWMGWWDPIAQGFAEDLSFCRRAKAVGYSIKVDTSLQIGHVGEVVVDSEFAKRNRVFEYCKWEPPASALLDSAAIRTTNAKQGGPVIQALDAARQPIASIVIPTYNQKPEFLRAAVQSALRQTVPVEVIVVDDGSADAGQCALAYQPLDEDVKRVCHLRHETNRGIAAALNTGIRAMRTPWFVWLSSDDLLLPQKVEFQLAALLATNRLCGYTGYDLKPDNHNGIVRVRIPIFRTREEQNSALSRYCAINGSTVMIHKSVFEAVGVFEESLRWAQDWAMWCRIGQKYDWHGMPDHLTVRREFQNLTAAMLKSEELRGAKEAEDEVVRQRYQKREADK